MTTVVITSGSNTLVLMIITEQFAMKIKKKLKLISSIIKKCPKNVSKFSLKLFINYFIKQF